MLKNFQEATYWQGSRFQWLVFTLAIVNLFLNNGSISFWDQDESAYAGFAFEMLRTGNWVVPDFLWSDPHRKTPFHFWAIAVSYQLFGINEFAVRFPSAMAVLLTGVALYFMGRPIFGKQISTLATMIMAASLFLPNLAKVSVTDSLLIFFETVAVLSIFNFYHKPNFLWALLLWMGVALAVLVKGPPVLILVFGVLGLLWIFYPRHWRWVGLHPWFGLPLSLVPLYLWGREAWLSDGGVYIRWMIDWYILKRASGGTTFGQWGPPGYYFLVFIIGFLPVLMYFFKSLQVLFKRLRDFRHLDEFYLFTGSWIIVGWFFYESIPSKLPAYAMGAYPAVALLIAKQILDTPADVFKTSSFFKRSLNAYLFFSLLISVALPIAAIILLDIYGILSALIVGIVCGGLAIYVFVLYRQGNSQEAFSISLMNGLLFCFLGWILLVPSFEEPRSATKRIAKLINLTTSKKTTVVFARPFYLPSLPFYVANSGRKYLSISEEDFDATILSYYSDPSKKPYVIVFDKDKFEIFEKKLKEQNLTLNPNKVRIISGWVSDMGKLIDYKIVYP